MELVQEPKIKKMNPLTILKISGKIVEDAGKLEKVLQKFTAIKHDKILVHGGGKQATELCLKLGIEPKLVEGRRITDKETLQIVTMVYAGWTNKLVVSQLQKLNCNASGFSGADHNLILAKKRSNTAVDFGFVGDIQKVNIKALQKLISAHIVPVFCAITHDGNGQLLNTNADSIAMELSSALSPFYKVDLQFCSDKEGVLADPRDETSIFRHIPFQNFSKYKQRGIISEGMIPKMENAYLALKNGVQAVKICGINGIDSEKGTKLYL